MFTQEVISYKCIITREVEDDCWKLYFPDLDKAFYDNLDEDPVESAKGYLSLYLLDLESEGKDFPLQHEITEEDKKGAEKVDYIVIDLAWERLITVEFNDDGSLKDPRQKELNDYYEECFDLFIHPDDKKVREIVERTLL